MLHHVHQLIANQVYRGFLGGFILKKKFPAVDESSGSRRKQQIQVKTLLRFFIMYNQLYQLYLLQANSPDWIILKNILTQGWKQGCHCQRSCIKRFLPKLVWNFGSWVKSNQDTIFQNYRLFSNKMPSLCFLRLNRRNIRGIQQPFNCTTGPVRVVLRHIVEQCRSIFVTLPPLYSDAVVCESPS